MPRGNAAAEQCDDFGWHPRGRIDPTLVAHTAQHSRLGLGHAWSRSAGYALTTAPSRTYVVLTIEGGFEFEVGGAAVQTAPGTLILLDGAVPTLARTLADTARFVWHFQPTLLRPGRSRFAHGEPLPTGGAALNALTAMTKFLLSAPLPTSEIARTHVTTAFESLLLSALEDAMPRAKELAPHRESLFMEALAVIEASFRDPAFSVTRLAKALAVSERALHNAFSSMGTTPRRELERARLAEVAQLAGVAWMAPAELALRAGFTSARQMQRALDRTRAVGERVRIPAGVRVEDSRSAPLA